MIWFIYSELQPTEGRQGRNSRWRQELEEKAQRCAAHWLALLSYGPFLIAPGCPHPQGAGPCKPPISNLKNALQACLLTAPFREAFSHLGFPPLR